MTFIVTRILLYIEKKLDGSESYTMIVNETQVEVAQK
jgi:putative lysine transport system permease protein